MPKKKASEPTNRVSKAGIRDEKELVSSNSRRFKPSFNKRQNTEHIEHSESEQESFRYPIKRERT